MIPKIIHYCWLSDDPIPSELVFYIEGWKRVLSDYEFRKWDFTNFDKSSSLWVGQAFDNKKYAFAADYIRLYALYHYGGIYLDSDVEVLRSFDDFLDLSVMIGWQQDRDGLEVAAFGAEKGAFWIKKCLDYYEDRPFVGKSGKFDMRALPLIVEDIIKINRIEMIDVKCKEEAMKVPSSCLPVFLPDFFSPKTKDARILITENTVTIHHFVASWSPQWHKCLRKIILAIGGENLRNVVSKIYRRFFYK